MSISKTYRTCDKYRVKRKNDHLKQHEVESGKENRRSRDREFADEWPQATDVGVVIRVFQRGINLALSFCTVCDQDVDKSIATPLRTGRRAAPLPTEDKDAHVRIVSPSRSEKSFRKLSPIIAVPRN